MSIVKKIKKSSLVILGCQAERWDDTWDQVKELADAFGEREVASMFEEWAETRRGEIVTRPVGEFLKVAPGLIQGITSLKPKPELVQLINDLVAVSQGEVNFDAEQQNAIGRVLTNYPASEIKSAFANYFSKIETDDFLLKRAAKDFIEKAEQIITFQRRRAEELRKTDRVMKDAITREQAQAALDIAEADKRRQDEAAFFDPLLDTETPTSQGG